MRVALVSAWYLASGGAEWVDHILGKYFPRPMCLRFLAQTIKFPRAFAAARFIDHFCIAFPLCASHTGFLCRFVRTQSNRLIYADTTWS